MKWLRFVYLAGGLALLGVVLRETDLHTLVRDLVRVGWFGIGVILLVYALSFVSDSAGWQLTIPSAPLNLAWLRRLVVVRMVGEALNNVTPAAGMGGEPVKALLLKRHYGVAYREAGASILLARTTNLLTLVPFLAGGLYMLEGDPRIAEGYKDAAYAAVLALGLGVAGFFLVQRLRLSSLASHRLSRSRFAARFAHHLEAALHHIREFDERLVRFYTGCRMRFGGALALALLQWILGVVEIYYAMYFLGQPVSLRDAWVIESVNQLIRAGTFFIPGSIGAQEGGFMLVCTALTGNPVVGVALAVVRRFRELVWIVAGLGCGWLYSLRTPFTPATQVETAGS